MIICKKAYRISRYALHKLSILFCILLVSCEWVNDDLSGCKTGTWLNFSYSYNILDVDAAYNQVDELSIFIFDSSGAYVGVQEVDSLQFLQNSAMVEIEQPEGEYKILVWGGLSDENYIFPELIEGESYYDDVVLTLSKSEEADENSAELASLFHCYLDGVIIPDYYNVIDAPLTKNNNHFSILIQDETGCDLTEYDFGVVIRSDNGALDYENNIVGDNYVNYTPYKKFTSEVTSTSLDGTAVTSTVYASYINMLRLMVGDDTYLSIVNTSTDERLVDISLVQYLLLTQGYYSETMESQEYLDRQDSYSFIFYFEKNGEITGGYVCTKVSVNGWIVRYNEAELSKN